MNLEKALHEMRMLDAYVRRLRTLQIEVNAILEKIEMSHANDVLVALIGKVHEQQSQIAQLTSQTQANSDLTVDANTLAQADALLNSSGGTTAPATTGTGTDTTGGTAQPTPAQPAPTGGAPTPPDTTGGTVQPPTNATPTPVPGTIDPTTGQPVPVSAPAAPPQPGV